MEKHNPVLIANDVVKTYGITKALDHVNITINAGEVRGLIGENGSGKSTLSSIIAGIEHADHADMTWLGESYRPKDMIDALNKGIGMIVQENGTIAEISIAENVFLGATQKYARLSVVKRRAMLRDAKDVLSLVQLDADPALPMATLDMQQRKLVEIAKVIARRPRLIIVDETTTMLSQTGRDLLYRLMRKMTAEGVSFLFISHDLDELLEYCDSLTVLRDGKLIRNLQKEEFDADCIKQLMVGRELHGDYYRSDFDATWEDEVVLELKNGYKANRLRDVSLQLHKGEILGIGGLSECGMHDLGKCLYGAEQLESGEVFIHGKHIRHPSEKGSMKAGIAYAAKDRDKEALCLDAPIRDNIAIAGIDNLKRALNAILPWEEKAYVQAQIDALQIKCHGMGQYVSTLSGGNKQKVLLGKWVACNSQIFILDCPTRGVDIGVKQAIYQLITRLKHDGISFLIISEEIAELIGMADRLLIMKDGAISAELLRSSDLSEGQVIEYMI